MLGRTLKSMEGRKKGCWNPWDPLTLMLIAYGSPPIGILLAIYESCADKILFFPGKPRFWTGCASYKNTVNCNPCD